MRPATPAVMGQSDSLKHLGYRVLWESTGGMKMNEAQTERVRQIVQDLSEKSGTSFDAAFETAIDVMKYHAVDAVPWGKSASGGSGGVEKR